ncbi:hypothetical protein AB0J47_22785 [Nocardia sp. NPDC049737]|uniref:hypothetical protein n=1 Tax=Nocardia sp. NPDC049737 TaxID=3154358 RepID=UPI00341752AC
MGDQDKPSTASIPGLRDLLDQRDVQVATQRSADSQSRARRDDAELSNLGAGADPDYVNTEEHFEGMTLEAMYAAVHGDAAGMGGLDATGLQTMRRTWFECFSELANLSTFNLMGLNRVFGNGLWQGASGSAAQNASQQYSAVANQVGRVFETMSQRLDSLGWAAEAVRIAVPAPPSSVVDGLDPDNPAQSVLPALINPEYSDQVDNAREEARQAAIRALNSVYKETFPPAGTGVPTYATVPQLGTNTDPGGIAANPGGVDPGLSGTDLSKSGDPSRRDATAGPTTTQPSSTAATDTSPTGIRTPDLTGSTPSTTTAPASVSSGPGASGASVLTGLGRGASSPGGAGTTPRTGGPGSSVPGAPGASTPGSVGSATGAAAATRAGIGTSGPMAPGAGARRKDGEGDGEHHAPDYLRGVASDWTEGLDTPVEVIGDAGYPDADPYAIVEPIPPTPVRTPQPAAPTFVEAAPVEPRNTVDAAAAPTANTVPVSDSSATPDAGIETKPTGSAGFSGTGPSLDSLFAEYGWSTDDSPAPPTVLDAGAPTEPPGQAEKPRSGTE